MSKRVMGRRAFLATTSAAGAMVMVAGSNLVIGGNGAWAMSTKALTGEEAAMLVRMARATYPHAMLDDAIYGQVIHGLDEKAASDPALLRSLQEGAATLKDKKFDTLDEAGQEARQEIAARLATFAFVRIHVFDEAGTQPDQLSSEELTQALAGAPVERRP